MTTYDEDFTSEMRAASEFYNAMAHGHYDKRACCGFCASWRFEVGDADALTGTCRKRPPSRAADGGARWPKTPSSEWCACFGWSGRAHAQLFAEYRAERRNPA